MPRVGKLAAQAERIQQRSGANGNGAPATTLLAEELLEDEGAEEVRSLAPEVLPPEPAIEAAADELPRRKPDEEFWDYCARIPVGMWGSHVQFWLYRADAGFQKVQGEKKYIKIYMDPVTSPEMIRAEFGGGRYKAYLKFPKSLSGPIVEFFDIDGAPILKPGQTIDGHPAPGAQPNPAPTAAPAVDVGDIIRQVLAAVKQNPDRSDAEILSSAMEGIKQASKISMDIVGEAAKQQIRNDAPKDPFAEITKVLSLVKQLQPERAEQKSMTEQLRELAELKKLLAPEAPSNSILGELKELGFGSEDLKDLIFGGKRKGSDTDWKLELLNFGKLALEKAPALLQQFHAMNASAQSRAQGQQRPPAQQPMALPPAPRSAGLGVPTGAIDAQPQPTVGPVLVEHTIPAEPMSEVTDEMIFDSALHIVATSFTEGDDGETAAICLKRAYPSLLPMVKPLLENGTPEQVLAWAKGHKVLGQVAGDAEFPVFLKEFTDEILDRTPPDEGESEA